MRVDDYYGQKNAIREIIEIGGRESEDRRKESRRESHSTSPGYQ